MKYKLNEQQLNKLITNSTMRVLSEAMEDEGLGRFLGDMAGRIRNGINKFTGDFNAARNNRMYQKRDYDSYQNYGYDPNSRNFGPNTARQYQDAKNAGASRASMGSYSTQYGDTVQSSKPQGNQQVEPQNTQQTEQPSASQNGPQNNPQMQQQQKPQADADELRNQMDKAFKACKDAGLTYDKNTGKFSAPNGVRSQSQNQLVQNYANLYQQWAQAAGFKTRKTISESRLNKIIKESIQKVLKKH